MSCDNDAKPTHLDVLRVLRKKVETDHGAPDHEGDPKAHERLRELGQTAENVDSSPKTAFDALALGHAAVKRAQDKARVDADRARAACEAEVAAVNAREKAQQEAKVSKARADELSKPMMQQKRRRVSDAVLGASGSSSAQADASMAIAVEDETDNEASWMMWTIPRWRKHEREMQKRRSVEMSDGADKDRSLPRKGDETQGWRWHWRRGMVGSVQDWANGSRFRAAFMLAELAIYFKVESEVL